MNEERPAPEPGQQPPPRWPPWDRLSPPAVAGYPLTVFISGLGGLTFEDASQANRFLIGCRHELAARGEAWYGPISGCPRCACWFLALGPAWSGAPRPGREEAPP